MTKIEIEKLENPIYHKGIYITLHDLESTSCNDYYDGIKSYNDINIASDNLDGLNSMKDWNEKLNNEIKGVIKTMNGTMNGFINIKEKGEYTFYLQTGKSMNAKIYIDNEMIISNWRECKDWNDIPLTKRMNLDIGYRRVLIEYFGGEDLDFRLRLDRKSVV